MGDVLADAVGGLGVAARPERALVQPLDRRRIVAGLGQDRYRKFVHGLPTGNGGFLNLRGCGD
jgi:hypothetical protein